jgi:hypothetical protein
VLLINCRASGEQRPRRPETSGSQAVEAADRVTNEQTSDGCSEAERVFWIFDWPLQLLLHHARSERLPEAVAPASIPFSNLGVIDI